MISHQPPSSCESCPLASRRRFLTGAARAFASAAAGLTLVPRSSVARWSDLVRLDSEGDVRVYTIPRTDGVHIDRGAQVILVREDRTIYAFRLRCPHQNTALRWRDDGWFQCPKHKSKYQPSGEFISGKATRGMDRFAIRRDGANVVVDLSRVYRQDDDPREWAAARIAI